MKKAELAGQRFGSLVAIHSLHSARDGRLRWHCQCDCGATHEVEARYLRSGNTTSCGCAMRKSTQRIGSANRGWFTPVPSGCEMGDSKSAEYRTWVLMRRRCLDPKCHSFEKYGGRGILVCAEWRDSFPSFLRDMGRKPTAAHSLDRIDNNGNYEPGNCRWATMREQTNNRRVTRFVTAYGQTKALTDWVREVGICRETIIDRLERGWSVERALSTPTRVHLAATKEAA